MSKPTRRQLKARRTLVAAILFSIIFGMGAFTQKAFYNRKYKAPVIALAKNKEVEDLYEVKEVKEYMVSLSVDGIAYLPERTYNMYNNSGIRTINVNGDNLFIGLDSEIPPGVTVHETEILGNKVRIIVRD